MQIRQWIKWDGEWDRKELVFTEHGCMAGNTPVTSILFDTEWSSEYHGRKHAHAQINGRPATVIMELKK